MFVRKMIWLGFAALLTGCATVPPVESVPRLSKTSLVSLALDRTVVAQGAQVETQGMLVDRKAWNKPLDEGAVAWSGVILDGWKQSFAGSLSWRDDSKRLADYETLTKIVYPDSWFGFDQPDAVRYAVPDGWNFVKTTERGKWQALLGAWGEEGLWSIQAVGYYVLEESSSTDVNYHLGLKTTVSLVGTDGAMKAQTTVVSYSKSHPYRNWVHSRGELPVTLKEAASDFLAKWERLAQN